MFSEQEAFNGWNACFIPSIREEKENILWIYFDGDQCHCSILNFTNNKTKTDFFLWACNEIFNIDIDM